MHGLKADREIAEDSLTIPADSFLTTIQYQHLFVSESWKREWSGQDIDADSLLFSIRYYHAL